MSEQSEPKFKYGDSVTVISGFYEGTAGRVVDYYPESLVWFQGATPEKYDIVVGEGFAIRRLTFSPDMLQSTAVYNAERMAPIEALHRDTVMRLRMMADKKKKKRK